MNTTQTLKPGSTLHGGTYRIDSVLGRGGFGITYLATDVALDMHVAIKEFFPNNFCTRDGDTSHVTLGNEDTRDFVTRLKQKFLKEARNIAKLHHPGIIQIHAAFEENGTSYYVMDYIEGATLADIVKRGGSLSESKALEYIYKVGDALGYVHSHAMNHLDVKPANIIVRRADDTPVLIDFGLSKQYDAGGQQTSTTPTGLSHGYAPLEQYNDGGVHEFSPQTDIYSLAATLYFLLTGTSPLPAPRLIVEGITFPQGFPVNLEAPIKKAMATAKKDRYSTVGEFIDDLNSTNQGTGTKTTGNQYQAPSNSGSANSDDLNRDTIIENNGDSTRINMPFVQSEQLSKKEEKKKAHKWWIAGVIAAFVFAILVAYVYQLSNQISNSGMRGLSDYDTTTAIVEDNDTYDVAVNDTMYSYDYVDLGLSVKWATCNLGALSPEEYGNYYAWAETEPRYGSSWDYDWDTTPYCQDSSGDSWSKYTGSDGKTVLDPEDDAATVALGSPWRMPTIDEIAELLDKCKWTEAPMNGVQGYVVEGPNGNAIFLPAAGERDRLEIIGEGTYCNYWSSSLYVYDNNPSGAYILYFPTDDHSYYYNQRCYGQSIRPVRP